MADSTTSVTTTTNGIASTKRSRVLLGIRVQQEQFVVISEPPEQDRVLFEQLDAKTNRPLDGLRRAASTAANKRPTPPALKLPKIRRKSASRLSFGTYKDNTYDAGQVILVQPTSPTTPVASSSTSDRSARHDRIDSTESTASSNETKSSWTSSSDSSPLGGDGDIDQLTLSLQHLACEATPPTSPGSPSSPRSSSIPISKKAKRRSSDPLASFLHGPMRRATKASPVHRQAKQSQLMPRPPIPRTSPLYRISSWESQDSQLDDRPEMARQHTQAAMRKLSLAEALKESVQPRVTLPSKTSSESLRDRMKLFKLAASTGGVGTGKKMKSLGDQSRPKSAPTSPMHISSPVLKSSTAVERMQSAKSWADQRSAGAGA